MPFTSTPKPQPQYLQIITLSQAPAILNMHPQPGLRCAPCYSPKVEKLPEQLQGRLRAMYLTHWHVHVIHEQYHVPTRRGAVTLLALTLQLALDDRLRQCKGRHC